MLDTLKSNLPVILMAALMLALFILGNRGVLSPEQAQAIMALFGVGGVGAAHRMDPPAVSK